MFIIYYTILYYTMLVLQQLAAQCLQSCHNSFLVHYCHLPLYHSTSYSLTCRQTTSNTHKCTQQWHDYHKPSPIYLSKFITRDWKERSGQMHARTPTLQGDQAGVEDQANTSTEQRPSAEANSLSAGQEIPHILWHTKVQCRVHNSSPPVPILSQLNPAHAHPPPIPLHNLRNKIPISVLRSLLRLLATRLYT